MLLVKYDLNMTKGRNTGRYRTSPSGGYSPDSSGREGSHHQPRDRRRRPVLPIPLDHARHTPKGDLSMRPDPGTAYESQDFNHYGSGGSRCPFRGRWQESTRPT